VTHTLSELWIYPVKSLGGIPLTEARVTARGLAYDRRFLLIDEAGQFLTQRQTPELAWFQPALDGETLRIEDRRGTRPALTVPLEPANSTERIDATVWGDTLPAQPVGAAADAWFSDALGQSVRFVYLPDDSHRPVDPRYARTETDETSFSDGYPFLLINQASLDGLNARLAEPVEMRRFRPNLVVTGGEAHAEDDWAEFRLGETTFFGVKPCARCVMITIHPDTTQRGPEPLRTLAGYRRQGQKVLFGQNLLVNNPGQLLRVGQSVEIVRHFVPAASA
jgi:hypothetical protein